MADRTAIGLTKLSSQALGQCFSIFWARLSSTGAMFRPLNEPAGETLSEAMKPCRREASSLCQLRFEVLATRITPTASAPTKASSSDVPQVTRQPARFSSGVFKIILPIAPED